MVGVDLYNRLKTIDSLKVCPSVINVDPATTTKYLVYNLDSTIPTYVKGETKVPSVFNYTLSIYCKKYDELETYTDQLFSLFVGFSSPTISLIRFTDAHDVSFDADSGLFQRDISVVINGSIGT